MSALLDSHQELLRFAIAERDAFYDCATDHEGVFNDKHDHDELERMDAMIDRAQEAQKNHIGDANKMDAPDHIPDAGKMMADVIAVKDGALLAAESLLSQIQDQKRKKYDRADPLISEVLRNVEAARLRQSGNAGDDGEVIGDHYDLGVAISRHFDELRDSATGKIAFDPCDSDDIDEVLAIISAHLSPAQSVEEIQADAVWEFSNLMAKNAAFHRSIGDSTNEQFYVDCAEEAHKHYSSLRQSGNAGDDGEVADDLPGMWDQSDLSGGATDCEPKHHILKTDPAVFAQSAAGRKPWEIRLNDRDFQVGDGVTLGETTHSGAEMRNGAPLKFTGNELTGQICYVLRGPKYGLADGWCIFSVEYGDAKREAEIRKYIEDTIPLVMQACGNSYANARCERLLSAAKSVGVYTGPTTGSIYDLMDGWADELDRRYPARLRQSGNAGERKR